MAFTEQDARALCALAGMTVEMGENKVIWRIDRHHGFGMYDWQYVIGLRQEDWALAIQELMTRGGEHSLHQHGMRRIIDAVSNMANLAAGPDRMRQYHLPPGVSELLVMADCYAYINHRTLAWTVYRTTNQNLTRRSAATQPVPSYADFVEAIKQLLVPEN